MVAAEAVAVAAVEVVLRDCAAFRPGDFDGEEEEEEAVADVADWDSR